MQHIYMYSSHALGPDKFEQLLTDYLVSIRHTCHYQVGSMDDNTPEFENETVEKASKWTIYFLIDLRVVFIILYVYVTAVNLISTTATAEATTDTECSNRYNITSGHLNVIVSSIDDAVLWNCRKLSETKIYYKGLYILLLVAFFITLLVFFIVKLTIIFGAKHDDYYLKRIGLLQFLEEKTKFQSEDIETMLKDTNYNLDKCDCLPSCCFPRRMLLFLSIIFLVIGMGLSLLFYDLHVLSCVFEQSDDFIGYDEVKEAVELRFSDNLSLSQKIAGGILIGLFFLFLINCFIFYHCTLFTIDNLKESLKKNYKQISS